ncbi:MAG: ATP-dependent helicase [Saprospiraceae bacterium]|nr:ATP-dependent helicase [Saprospiraceae bacterium]
MQYISSDFARYLFDELELTLRNPGLTETERIPKYRSFLDALFKELTRDEKRYLNDLNNRITFIATEYNTPEPVKNLAHHLRRFANSVVHGDNTQPGPADDALCLYALATVTAHFGQQEIPDLIRKSYENYQDSFEKRLYRVKPKTPGQNFRAIVRHVYVPQEEDNKKYCAIVCDTDELGAITIRFWNNKKADGFGSDLSGVHEFLEPYCNIYVTEIKPQPGKEGEFNATDKTLLVLEPDYLIEAKELAECCQQQGDNPLIHLLNRFSKGEISDKMMIGTLAGQLLDDMATNPAFNYTDSFDTMMRSNSFPMLCLAHKGGQYRREEVKMVYDAGGRLLETLKYALDAFKSRQLILEPTFISSQYGLQGRLDILLEDPADPLRKDIVEMKSGRFPKDGLYPNHEAQALAYSLMLETTFPGRKGVSAILYAKATRAENPIRGVREESHLRKQQLLLLRNRIVANELQLANGKTEVLEQMRPGAFGPIAKFNEEDVAVFHQTLQSLSPLLRAWFVGYTQFIFGEMRAAKIGNPANPEDAGGFSALWKATPEEKTNPDNYSTLTNLRLVKVTDDFRITLKNQTDLFNTGVTNFRDNEVAILYPTPDPENPNPLAQQILKCTILSIGPEQVEVSLANKQLNKSYFEKKQIWAIERDFRESGYRTMLQLLFRFLQSDDAARQLILGLKRPEFAVLARERDLDARLNDNQRDIVLRALAARHYFLIQGPPGTGKTSTILRELVRQMATDGLNIMVIAFTNQAVKVICEKLHELDIPFIRLGKGEEPYTWQTLSGSLKLNELHEKVAQTRVFVSTQATFSGSLDLLKFKKFHTLIVDEASQLLEPQLAGILPQFERFLMIGDDNQLPAVVLQAEEDTRAEAPELHAIELKNFRESLFTRLLQNAKSRGWTDCYGLLEYHFRMHADIAAFPNEHFYDSRLRTGLAEQQAPIQWPEQQHPFESLFRRRVAFVPSRVENTPKVNDEEATLVAELIAYVHQLYGDRFDPTQTVGVITPFRAQIAKIRQKLPEQYQAVTIDTVERFQGSERDVIIVSFAVKNALQLRSIQSINADGVDRKLNVMLTRAKEHLVLIGVPEVLRKSGFLGRLVDGVGDLST